MMYKGKVEINEDPKGLDRIKVRIFGVHPNQETLANQDLQWADPIMLAGESVVPNVGDIVYCDFIDNDMQKIVYLGQASYQTDSGSSIDSLYENESLTAAKNQDDRIEKTRRNKYEFVRGNLNVHVYENVVEQVDGTISTTTKSIHIGLDGAQFDMEDGKFTFTSNTKFTDISFGGINLVDFIKNLKVVGNLGALAPLDPALILLLETAVTGSKVISIGV